MYVNTVKDFINIFIHVLSQAEHRWLPAVGITGYINSLYNYMNSMNQSLDVLNLRDIHTSKLVEILKDSFWNEEYKLDDFSTIVDEILNYINIKDSKYYSWLSRVLKLSRFKTRGVQIMFEQFSFNTKYKAHYIPFSSDVYPKMLQNILDPPTAIQMIGNPSIFLKPMLSIIGSRLVNQEAEEESFNLAKELSQRGIVVVSGGALGCDIASHLGVLSGCQEQANKKPERECNTLVVFAGGLKNLYPKRHRHYFMDIVNRGGALVSERLWNDRCLKKDFPVRNRIISGLSGGVVVIQSRIRSGASVTAQFAVNQGRELYVLLRDKSGYSGNLRYFKEGALGYYGYRDFLNKKFYKCIKI